MGIELEEDSFPVSPEVRTASDMLGLNPLEIANEGVLVAVVDGNSAGQALAALRGCDAGAQAAVVGTVTAARPGVVLMRTRIGGKRILDFPRGLLLPRIC